MLAETKSPPKPMTVEEVAERLGVTRFHVHRLITAGELVAINVGCQNARRRTLRVFQDAFDKFLRVREEEVKTNGQVKSNRRRTPGWRARLVAAGILQQDEK